MKEKFLRYNRNVSICIALVLIVFSAQSALAQTSEFVYQGRLNDNSALAFGNFDFEFRLFDVSSGGAPLATQQRLNVSVSGGVFTVQLDFGASAFNGSPRFLEVAVKPAGGGSFTTITPRQPFTSTPYSVRSLNASNADTATNATNATNALQLGGVAANQYVQTNDSRLSDARNPLPNSANYIQNTTSPQSSSNFNISGNGTAGGTLSGNIVNTATQFNIGNNRVLAGGLNNLYVGNGAGVVAASGDNNTFVGTGAGSSNILGSNNTTFGWLANVGSNNLTNAAAIGSRAFVTQSNSLILGSINGVNGATVNTNVGIGTTSPTERLQVVGNGLFTGNLTVTGTLNATLPSGSGNYIQNTTTQQSSSNFNISGNGTLGGTLAANSLLVYPTSGNGSLSIRNRANTNYSQVVFYDDANVYRGYIGYIGANGGLGARNDTIELGTNGKDLTFRPNEEVMRLKTSGKVGIGTSNPTFKLEVIDPSNTGLRVQVNSADGTVASFGGIGEFLVDAPGVPGGRFRITDLGNVGIGGVFSDSKLTVSGTGYIRASINSDSNAGLRLSLNNQSRWSLATVTGGQFQIYNDFTGQNALWIDPASNNVAIGTTSTSGKLRVDGGNEDGLRVTTNNSGSFVGYFGPTGRFAVDSPTIGGTRFLVANDGTVSINNGPVSDNSEKLFVNGVIRLNLATGGLIPLCQSSQGHIAACGSSIRYKQNIGDFTSDLSLVKRLRPVTFNWKANNQADMGLVAEEVAEVEPLLVTRNDKGEIEGVKYDRVGVVLINAVKEQQAQIERQQKQIDDQKESIKKQQAEIEALKILVCSQNQTAEICKPKK